MNWESRVDLVFAEVMKQRDHIWQVSLNHTNRLCLVHKPSNQKLICNCAAPIDYSNLLTQIMTIESELTN